MGTNEEFFRIQSWIADWYGTSVEDCKYSREDIRDICRGPMREVLLDFILPRFRTDEQIKVFRSNLYLNDIQRSPDEDEKGKGISQQDRQIKNLTNSIEKLQDDKVETVRRISRASCKMTDTKMSLQRVILENLATFENLDARVHYVRDRVQSTNTLLEDLNQIKPSTGPDSPTIATIINDPSSDSLSPQMHLLQSLSTNAIALFNHIFLPNASANSLEIQSHTAEVTAKISELTQSGLSPNTVEKWAWNEQEKYSGLIKNAGVRYSNRMSPVEELSTEADALHVRLMKAHVDTHFKFRDLNRIHEELKAQNTKRIQNSVLSDEVVAPANLLSFVQKEEQQRKLIKCRELLEKFRNSDGSNDEDEEFLGLICDDFVVDCLESGSKIRCQQQNGENGLLNKPNFRMSLGPGEGISNFVKQETLEDLTIALLKSYPQSRQQLDATIKQCKNLVLERFPKLFLADQSGNDRKFANGFGSARGEGFSHSSEYQIKIPQHLLLNKSTTEASCVFQEQDEFVAEVTGLQSELEKNRLQCEVMFNEMRLP